MPLRLGLCSQEYFGQCSQEVVQTGKLPLKLSVAFNLDLKGKSAQEFVLNNIACITYAEQSHSVCKPFSAVSNRNLVQ